MGCSVSAPNNPQTGGSPLKSKGENANHGKNVGSVTEESLFTPPTPLKKENNDPSTGGGVKNTNKIMKSAPNKTAIVVTINSSQKLFAGKKEKRDCRLY